MNLAAWAERNGEAINAATPAINTAATEPLTESQLQTLYSLR